MIISGKRYPKLQAYKEKNNTDYLIVDFNEMTYPNVEALCPSIENAPTSICCSQVGISYLNESCTEISWKKIPQIWQVQFAERLELPYVEFQDGTTHYRNKEGKFQRIDGPAIKMINKKDNTEIQQWWLEGVQYNECEFNAIILNGKLQEEIPVNNKIKKQKVKI